MFKRIVSLAFTMAGVYWLFMYGFEWAGWVTRSDVQVLRSGQTIIYFILLTIWGIEYLREAKRLSHVMEIANAERTAPDAVELSQISRQGLFAVLRPIGEQPALIMPIVNWLGIMSSVILIAIQYVRLFGLL